MTGEELAGFHVGDTYNPVDPDALPDRLRRLGFERITLGTGQTLNFVTYKPLSGCTA